MKVNPINSVRNIIKRRKQVKEATELAMNVLSETYGDKIHHYRTLSNKNGVVSVLGYPKNSRQYTHAFSVLPDGTQIEKVINREKTPTGIINHYLTLVKDKLGKYTYSSERVQHSVNVVNEVKGESFYLAGKPNS